MATFNLVVNYPDGEGPRILAALKTHWTVDGVVPTTAQVIEKLRLVVAQNIIDITLRVERDAAIAAAAAAVVPVNAT
jgi:hypothetical protein